MLAPQHPPHDHASRRLRGAAFSTLAVAFGLAAVFHAVAIAVPAIAEPSPAWRHALFVGINLALACGFVLRPRWFPWAFAVLTTQQVYSHGLQGWHVWAAERRIDWASLLVLLALPPIAWLLFRERRRGGAGARAGA